MNPQYIHLLYTYVHRHILYMYMCRYSSVHMHLHTYVGIYSHVYSSYIIASHIQGCIVYTHMYMITKHSFVCTQTWCTHVQITYIICTHVDNTPFPISFEPKHVCALMMPSHLVPVSACPLPTDSKHVHMFIHSTLTQIGRSTEWYLLTFSQTKETKQRSS